MALKQTVSLPAAGVSTGINNATVFSLEEGLDAVQVQQFGSVEPDLIDWSKPFVIRGCDELKDIFYEDAFKSERDLFQNNYTAAPSWKAKQVANRTTQGLEKFGKLVMAKTGLTDIYKLSKEDKLEKADCPEAALFVCSPTFTYGGAEYREHAVFRYLDHGARQVVCCPYKAVSDLLHNSTVPNPSRAMVVNYVANLTAEEVKRVKDKTSFYNVLVSPQDLMYVPMGFITIEKTLNATTAGGVRLATLFKVPALRADVKTLFKTYEVVKPSKEQQALMARLDMMSKLFEDTAVEAAVPISAPQ